MSRIKYIDIYVDTKGENDETTMDFITCRCYRFNRMC